MAQVLAYMLPDGENFLPTETRNRVVRSLLDVPITYSDVAGEGLREFLVQNVSGESSVRNLVFSTITPPTDEDDNTLTADWAYYDEVNKEWTTWTTTATIANLEPGKFVRVRMRLRAGENAEPRSYFGVAAVDFDEVITA